MSAELDPRRWMVLGILALSLLVVALDLTVLNVAIPTLARELRPSAEQLLWIVDIYSLMVAGLLLSAGSLGDRIGRKRMLCTGFVLFGGASALAAWAGSPEALIVARAMLGLSAAVIMPSTLSIIRNVFTDRKERTLALGVWSAVAGAGAAIGPLVGGLLLEHFWWGSVFLINLPIMVIALVLGIWLVPESRDPNPQRWDYVGSILSVVGLVGLVYGIQEAGSEGVTATALITGIGGLAVLVLLVMWLRRTSDPLIDLTLFRRRTFAVGVGAVVISMFGMVGMLFLLTQHLQSVMGVTPFGAGLRTLPLVVGTMIGAPLVSVIVPRLGTRVAMSVGLVITAASLLLLVDVDPNTGYLIFAIALGGIGVGAGCAMTTASDAIMSTASAERAGGAAGIEQTSYEFGGGLSVAVMGSIAGSIYRDHVSAGTSGLPPEAAHVVNESVQGALAVSAELPPEVGGPLAAAAKTAFVDSFSFTATVAGVGIALIGIGAFFLVPKSAGIGGVEEQSPAPQDDSTSVR